MWLCSVKSNTILLKIPGQNSINLKIEATCYSEISMSTHQPTQDQNPNLHLNNACHESTNYTLVEYGYKIPSCVKKT
jgi:hypothetical protein